MHQRKRIEIVVERVRADINRAGLVAEMESSSADGARVRARLRVGDKS